MTMLSIDNGYIYYSVRGIGTPIIFIHPPTITSEIFRYQREELSKNFQFITFDIRGHGRSSEFKEPLTYPLIAQDIVILMDRLHIAKAFICGYSMGGSIALEFLLHYPNRALGGILLGPMSELIGLPMRSSMALGVKMASTGPAGLRALALSVSYSNANNKKTFRALYREALKGSYRNVSEYYACGLSFNCTDQLKNILAPVLLLYGAKDTRFGPHAELLSKGLPNHELKFVHDVKHQLPMKAAIETNDLIKQFIYMNKEIDKARHDYEEDKQELDAVTDFIPNLGEEPIIEHSPRV